MIYSGVWHDPAPDHLGDHQQSAEDEHGGGERNIHRPQLRRDLASAWQGEVQGEEEDGHGVHSRGRILLSYCMYSSLDSYCGCTSHHTLS